MNCNKNLSLGQYFKKVFRLSFILIFYILILSSCGASNGQVGSDTGSVENVLKRVSEVQKAAKDANGFVIPSVSEEEIYAGKTSTEKLSVSTNEFKKSCVSGVGKINVDSQNRYYAWINDSYVYFSFKLSKEYIRPKTFVLYYTDVLDKNKYDNIRDNPVLQYAYISFNGIVVNDLEITDEALYTNIPKQALLGDKLEIIILFPTGNGSFYEKGKNLLSILGVGFTDLSTEIIDPPNGIGYGMHTSINGNLKDKTSTGWYLENNDVALTTESMKFYFNMKEASDLNLSVDYDTLNDDQECKVYYNDKYAGDLSKTSKTILPKSAYKEGVQKVEIRIENPVPATKVYENAKDTDYLGIVVRSITIK